jgi:putative transposase
MKRRKENRKPLPRIVGWRDLPDEMWEKIAPFVPPDPQSPKGGCPAKDHRKIMDGILYVLRTGCQWKMMPREYGSGSTVHRHFQQWTRAFVFEWIWRVCLEEYDDLKGIDWHWQVADGATVSSPVKGGTPRGKIPRIEGNSEPNGTCMSTETVSHSA